MQDFWSSLYPIIEEECSNYDKVWQKRKRVITTQFLVIFILKLVLSKNKQGYKILLNEFWESKEFAVLQQNPISASSLCEARQKMPETIFFLINNRLIQHRESNTNFPLWHGHRLFSVDGSKINLPRELIKSGYKAPNKHQYYPQGLMSTLYNLGNGLIYDGELTSNTNERICLLKHMESLSPGDILVLDRGYFSYLILTKAIEKNIHLICRMQSGTVNSAVQDFWDGEKMDEIITYKPSDSVKYDSKKQGYDIELKPIKVRLIKYIIDETTYVCSTTFLCQQTYPLSDFPKVYHGRWGIEELYKISKGVVEVEDFHSKTELGVKQECYAHMLLINIARIFESETDHHIPPPSIKLEDEPNQKNSYWQNFCKEIKTVKTNFKNCILVVGRHLYKILLPDSNLNFECIPIMLNSISRVRQKIRPGRHEPRQSRKPINKWKCTKGTKVGYA